VTPDPRPALIADAVARHRAGKLTRRQVIGLLGALGLSAAAVPVLVGRNASAKTATGGHGGHLTAAQEPAAAAPAATPSLGERPDGSATFKVVAGGMVMEELIDVLAFFPTEVTVNVGDSLFWETAGFHNVHFLSGQPLPPGIVPETALVGAASPPASPASGPPRLFENPVVVTPSGGTTYDGSGVVNSGILDPSAPFVLSFTAPGAYDYYCTIHGEVMKGTVVVQEQGATRPEDQAAIDRRGTTELEAQIAQAEAMIAAQDGAATPAAGGVHEVAVGLSGGQFAIDRFFPAVLTIGVGETVRFVNPTTAPPAPHIVTFLSGAEAPELVFPEPSEAGPPLLVFNPQLLTPAGGETYGGEGFFSSGLLFAETGVTDYELTFATPGTYRYYCAFHGSPDEGMFADIVVE